MRFVSPYGRYNLGLIPWKQEKLADGTTRTLKEGFMAQFGDGDFTDQERQAAYDHFGSTIKKGSRRDESGNDSDQDWRIGTFDTLDIHDLELRSNVEKLMVDHPLHGRDFLLVQRPATPAPWPRYDEVKVIGRRTIDDVARQIVEKIEELGLDPDQVIAYERENLNREQVVAAVTAHIEGSQVAGPIEVTV